jgi:serine O-acetyltransferase
VHLLESIREDIGSALDRDPAASSTLTVVLCSPGLWAVWAYRIHHKLWNMGLKLPARVYSVAMRLFTGVDIHPGAQIGRRLFIDHGIGVVIGETAIIGDDVTLYQGVTLGGTGKERGKRHPTLRDRVFVGNNANILGNITIGENSRVGAGSVVVRDVPPDSTVVGVPAHIVYQEGKRVLITDPREVRDPLAGVIIALGEEVKRLQARVDKLDGELAEAARGYATGALNFEDEERSLYGEEQSKLNPYVSMGEGI